MGVGALDRPAPTRAGRWPRPNAIALIASAPVLLIVGLVAVVALISLQESPVSSRLTLEHYRGLYTDPAAYRALANTVAFAATVVFWAFFFGLPLAWLAERTDLRAKTILYTGMTLGVLIPGFITAMGWILLLHPRSGLVPRWTLETLGWRQFPLNLLSLTGMGWVEGVTLASVVFILTGAGLRRIDGSLEEAAQASGAGLLARLLRVTLPLALPGLAGAAIFVLAIALSTFDVPLVVGLSNRIYVFSTYLYTQASPHEGVSDYGSVGAFSAFMLGLGLLLGWLYSRVLARAASFQVVRGRGYRPQLLSLGAWQLPAWLFAGTYLLLAVGMPVLVLAWTSLLPFLQLPSERALMHLSLANFTDNMNWKLVQTGLAHTLVLMVAAPALALTMSMALSWVVLRSRSRLSRAYDYVAFLPQAVPRIVFAFAAFLAALIYLPRVHVDIFDSLAELVLTMALIQVAFGTRLLNASLVQIHSELEEAAEVAGASTMIVIRRVTLPLLRPALLYGFLWLAMLSYRDLTVPALLVSRDNITLSVVIWDSWRNGFTGEAAAIVLVMLVALAPLIAVYWRFSGAGRRVDI